MCTIQQLTIQYVLYTCIMYTISLCSVRQHKLCKWLGTGLAPMYEISSSEREIIAYKYPYFCHFESYVCNYYMYNIAIYPLQQ